MPSKTYLILRSAQRARLEGRIIAGARCRGGGRARERGVAPDRAQIALRQPASLPRFSRSQGGGLVLPLRATVPLLADPPPRAGRSASRAAGGCLLGSARRSPARPPGRY